MITIIEVNSKNYETELEDNRHVCSAFGRNANNRRSRRRSSNITVVMRVITLLIIHCSAVKLLQTSSAAQIDAWHRARGYPNGIGYHYVIRRDGSIEKGRPESMVGAHVKDHNRHSIGICYEGGLNAEGNPEDTRTEAQKLSLRSLLSQLKEKYPRAIIVGHNTFANKACPCYRPEIEYKDLQPK